MKAIKVNGILEVARLYWLTLNRTVSELQMRFDHPEVTVFEKTIISAMISDIKAGRMTTVEKLTDRVLGKAREYIHLEGTMTVQNSVDLSRLSSEQLNDLEQLLARARVAEMGNTPEARMLTEHDPSGAETVRRMMQGRKEGA